MVPLLPPARMLAAERVIREAADSRERPRQDPPLHDVGPGEPLRVAPPIQSAPNTPVRVQPLERDQAEDLE
jgi:hypothetical protein